MTTTIFEKATGSTFKIVAQVNEFNGMCTILEFDKKADLEYPWESVMLRKQDAIDLALSILKKFDVLPQVTTIAELEKQGKL